MSLSTVPIARVQMLIRKPVATTFEAFVDPNITSQFWFTRSTGRLQVGSVVTWYWDMYGASADVSVKAIEPGRRIVIEWPTAVEWSFQPYGTDATMVTITASGFTGSDDEVVAEALDSVEGFTLVLAGCKAFLEHRIRLNLTADHHPPAEGPL